ncbi:3H domain-containing protein [Methanobrevibacter cuticularis]|uniref:3H domain-containing protein n=1 Tax=Methanobrevibacter cuticularis TaxID=47311 RepID=UPI00082EEF33|nr:3H domain-containing protein [Methanobrevibacter cuticularis]
MKKPYVILIGSASGIGKSTVAAELAKKLGIKHLLETDFIREVIRGIIGKDYAPVLHKSSFDAYTVLKNQENFDSKEDLINAGFVEHSTFVIPAIEKVINRSTADFDDIIIEGVHLVPGLINTEKFKNVASIYFFVLSADEESHKDRFVIRAMQIRRGGKQLEYFKENRTIHNFLVKTAEENGVRVIATDEVDNTVQQMLRSITEQCETVYLQNTVEELADVVDIIVNKNGGIIEDVSYMLPGFREPLKRRVNATDMNQAKKFLKSLEDNPKIKKDFEYLYKLSKNVRGTKICAQNKETLKKIIEELEIKGYVSHDHD